jgi:16S rRNA (guanine527-N7)-methyltransferase
MVLLEPLARRVSFLEEACQGLAITVVRGRAQDIKARSQVVTARAVAPLEKLKLWSWHLLDKGGVLLAIKGQNAGEESASVAGAQLHEIKMDGLELGRVISLQKNA